MRNLIFFLIVLWIVFQIRRAIERNAMQTPDPAAGPAPAAQGAETVEPCENCGVLVPASEGVTRDGHFFCSVEHAAQGSNKGSSQA